MIKMVFDKKVIIKIVKYKKTIMHYNNGDKYEGDYKTDKRGGKGIMDYNNGDWYEGYFKMIYMKDMEYWFIKMMIDIKINLKIIFIMEKEYIIIIKILIIKKEMGYW